MVDTPALAPIAHDIAKPMEPVQQWVARPGGRGHGSIAYRHGAWALVVGPWTRRSASGNNASPAGRRGCTATLQDRTLVPSGSITSMPARVGKPAENRPVRTYGPRRRRDTRRRVGLALGIACAVLAAVWATGRIGGADGADAQALDPSAFSPGACIALAPTSGNRHLTVFLDAGHGGIDPGAIGTTTSGATIYEADETLPVELDAARLLRAQGFRVVVSRTRDSSVVRLTTADLSGQELSLQGAHDDVAARDVCANLAQANVLVGIYFDSGATPANAGSLTTYDTARPFSGANLRLATLVQDAVLAAMNAQGWAIPNAGVVPDSVVGSSVATSSTGPLAIGAANYDHVLLLGPVMAGYFTTPSLMPGALIEPLFITDPSEGSIAASTSGQAVIARGLATAIEQYFAPPTHPPNA